MRAITPTAFEQGGKKVLVAAPTKGALDIVVSGVNDDRCDPAEHHLFTAASCTTNCLAPLVKALEPGRANLTPERDNAR